MATNQLTRNGTRIASYTYQYDPAGNITGITDTVDAAYNRQFGYDDLGRLTSTSTGAMLWGTRTLAYDAMGNLKNTVHGATLNYSGSLPKLTSVTEAGVTTPVTYDPAGNELTALKTSSISPRNYIAQMSTAAMDYVYKYDGRGVRTWSSEVPKPATGTTTKRYHFYTPDLRFLARTDYTVTATGTTVNRTIEPIWFAGIPVAQIDYNDLSTLRYTFTDHLGTPILQTNALGAIIWRLELEPYGRPYRIRTGSESAQPLRLPGQELAGDGKENYNVFRWYRSWWGRYTQADPIRISAARDPYSYAAGRPIVLIDRLGLQTAGTTTNSSFFSPCCDQALAAGLFDDASAYGERVGGLVVCCNGSHVPCARTPDLSRATASGRLAFGLAIRCVVQHEDRHVADLPRCPCGNATPPVVAARLPSSQRAASECSATTVELECLERSKSFCHGDAVCLQSLRAQQDYVAAMRLAAQCR